MEASLSDIKEITIESFEDFRGEIYTTYKNGQFSLDFNHDKVCIRYKDVLVGIHGDNTSWKLVNCLYGRVFCALVDYRKESKDYLKHKTYILSNENKRQLLIPPNIGNSFLVLSDFCIYSYKLSYVGDYIDCDKQFTLKWNDPRFGIKWPISNPKLSDRDA
jgi:dTDP-4-dehydrorhamnose 3,5-epimerase